MEGTECRNGQGDERETVGDHGGDPFKGYVANVRRDAEHERLWREDGWNVIVIWECGLKTLKDRGQTFAKLAKWLAGFA